MRSTRKLIGTAVLAAASLLAAAPGLAQERSPDVTQEPSSEAAQERSPDATQVESQAAPLSPFGPTEIADSANDALNAAGIEIPFPQRDLHLRTIDDGVSIDVNPP